MPITDLTGYTWVGNDEIDLTDIVSEHFINIVCNNVSYSSIGKVYGTLREGDYLTYNNLYAFNTINGWLDNAYKTIQITGGTDATNTNLISWLEANGTLQQPITPTKTFDLSTLGLSAGTHTIQVKARATGYRDSNFSNSVSYVVAQIKVGNS